MKTLIVALALVAVPGLVFAQHPVATLSKQKDLKLFTALVEMAGATGVLSEPKARVTLLAPTDADMGLTADDVKKNPALAKAILAYHTILGAAAGPKELFAKGPEVIVPTAAGIYKIVIEKAGDAVTATDFQGNVATITAVNLGSDNHQIHVIDRVLFSGSYWPNLATMVKVLPDKFSTLAKAAEVAKLSSALTAKDFDETIFIPTNDAFTAAGVKLDAPADKIATVLKYHVVPGFKVIPTGFVAGEPVKTLEGSTVTVTFKEDGAKKSGQKLGTAFVTDTSGNTVKVIKPNLFISGAVGHVIDGVLIPGPAPAAKPAATEAPAAAAPAEKPTAETKPAPAPAAATATATSTASSSIASLIPTFSITSTGKSVSFAGVTVTIKKPALGTGSRKLLQGNSGANVYTPTIELDSAEQSIQDTLEGIQSTADATSQNIADAQLATAYNEQPTYADGITPYSGYGGGGN
eukprot:gene3131-3409_t